MLKHQHEDKIKSSCSVLKLLIWIVPHLDHHSQVNEFRGNEVGKYPPLYVITCPEVYLEQI